MTETINFVETAYDYPKITRQTVQEQLQFLITYWLERDAPKRDIQERCAFMLVNMIQNKLYKKRKIRSVPFDTIYGANKTEIDSLVAIAWHEVKLKSLSQ